MPVVFSENPASVWLFTGGEPPDGQTKTQNLLKIFFYGDLQHSEHQLSAKHEICLTFFHTNKVHLYDEVSQLLSYRELLQVDSEGSMNGGNVSKCFGYIAGNCRLPIT